jgi:hypothetical protein
VIRKIIQIAVEPGFATGDKDVDGDSIISKPRLWVLCDDGTVFSSWVVNDKRIWKKAELPESVDVCPKLGN